MAPNKSPSNLGEHGMAGIYQSPWGRLLWDLFERELFSSFFKCIAHDERHVGDLFSLHASQPGEREKS